MSDFDKKFDEKFGLPFAGSVYVGGNVYYSDERNVVVNNVNVDMSSTTVNNKTEVRKSDNKLTLAAGDSVLGTIGGAIGKLMG